MYKGLNGQVEITDTNVVIKRKGATAFLSKGFAGEKSIPINAITAVQLQTGSFFSGNGFIKFCYGGSNEHRGNLKEATKDDNAVVFRPKDNAVFEDLKRVLDERISRLNLNSRNGSNVSSIEELERLAKLREQGHITEEEFVKKKSELL